MTEGIPPDPMMAYEDPGAALEWLSRAFVSGSAGAGTPTPTARSPTPRWSWMARSSCLKPTPEYQSPRHHAEECEHAKRWSAVPYVIDGLHVVVEAVDDHYRRAVAAGAEILSEPRDEPYGERTYKVADLEGHRWMFAQPI